MNKDYLRLTQLLQNNKITKTEFNVLVSKCNYKTWLDIIIIWIFNPYNKLSPKMALIFGFGCILLLSYLSKFTGFHFLGIPGSEEIFNSTQKLSYLQLFSEQFLQWITLSTVFYLVAKINKAFRIRLIDFFAFVAMAYLARIVFGFELFVIKLIDINFYIISGSITKLSHSYSKFIISLWHINQWLMYVWLYRLYFASLELASGLSKTRIWTTYIISMVVAQSIYYNISKYLLHWIV